MSAGGQVGWLVERSSPSARTIVQTADTLITPIERGRERERERESDLSLLGPSRMVE